jgi:hypothetical protein
LASLGKIKVNFYITVAMGLFNIIADVVLIYWMGSIGGGNKYVVGVFIVWSCV